MKRIFLAFFMALMGQSVVHASYDECVERAERRYMEGKEQGVPEATLKARLTLELRACLKHPW